MPGHLGNVNRTIQNLTIVKIMPDENVMLVKGSIPGHKGSVVIIKPTEKKYTAKEIYSEKEIEEPSSAENKDIVEAAEIKEEKSQVSNEVKQDADMIDVAQKEEDGKGE